MKSVLTFDEGGDLNKSPIFYNRFRFYEPNIFVGWAENDLKN